ncbi:hypothetical protein RHMOL_Rhmol13G0132400 [Rhododendron molle]|uniref:Uncharacterized protein n=1 Tax=Rhododendron molle TaxID=49168 RepID=A0ACC0L740_RHOML|nr:hypothetical protein RHMOL_Rhmol13G0132400 [Rhododendron molle]
MVPVLLSFMVLPLRFYLNVLTYTCCAERELAACDCIRSVKRTKMNAGRKESLVYVHYNHQLFTHEAKKIIRDVSELE